LYTSLIELFSYSVQVLGLLLHRCPGSFRATSRPPSLAAESFCRVFHLVFIRQKSANKGENRVKGPNKQTRSDVDDDVDVDDAKQQ
jgi:hypothetical protein